MGFRLHFVSVGRSALVCVAWLTCAPAWGQDAEGLPDAPEPQVIYYALSAAETSAAQNPAPPAPVAAGPQSSSSQAPAPQNPAEKTQRERAEEQIKEQEHQRVMGVIPSFNISYRSDTVPMTAGQKIKLAFHSATDPVTFATAFVVAGWGEASDSDSGFPWGPKGYFERSGAKYLDAFDGTMIGNGFLPALLHQDPRYFRLGRGSKLHRTLYAISSAFICKHDSGRWEPNYSNVIGNIGSGAISNLYYPSDTGIGLTISNGMIVTAEGAAGGLFNEFWPDISRALLHKDPTNGRDAQARQADEDARRTRQSAKAAKKKQPLPPAPK